MMNQSKSSEFDMNYDNFEISQFQSILSLYISYKL